MALNGIGVEELPGTAVLDANDVIVVEDLWRTYDMGSEQQVQALRGISLKIRHNEYVAIMGPSGSGKSTLMNLIGCLDTPSKGSYWLNGQLVSDLDDDQLARIRNKEIGFVFQTCWPAPPHCTTWNCRSSTTARPPRSDSNAPRRRSPMSAWNRA
jgi:putative ABC transport system ATP-binding protein